MNPKAPGDDQGVLGTLVLYPSPPHPDSSTGEVKGGWGLGEKRRSGGGEEKMRRGRKMSRKGERRGEGRKREEGRVRDGMGKGQEGKKKGAEGEKSSGGDVERAREREMVAKKKGGERRRREKKRI